MKLTNLKVGNLYQATLNFSLYEEPSSSYTYGQLKATNIFVVLGVHHRSDRSKEYKVLVAGSGVCGWLAVSGVGFRYIREVTE